MLVDDFTLKTYDLWIVLFCWSIFLSVYLLLWDLWLFCWFLHFQIVSSYLFVFIVFMSYGGKMCAVKCASLFILLGLLCTLTDFLLVNISGWDVCGLCQVEIVLLPLFYFAQWVKGCRIRRLHLCRGVRPPPTSVLTLNNLMVRFQWCWNFG